MTNETLMFAPLVPWPVLAALAVLAVAALGLAILRGLPGWGLRGVVMLALGVVLSGPKLYEETRVPLPDILLVMTDESASQTLGLRRAQGDAALRHILDSADRARLEVRQAQIPDGTGGQGTLLLPPLENALAHIPPDQLAGVVIISDGALQDAATLSARLKILPAPVILLQNGSNSAWDRRLTILQAPRFAVTGEETEIRLRIDALGNAPQRPAELLISIDGRAPERHMVRVGRDLALPLVPDHAGETVVHLQLVPLPEELTTRNNQAALRINGIRDRLRVLLVSGEPHPGTRTWRNLLKSDASVDLVHFTILRPPEKQDGVPVHELSLIPFPTQDLFIDKIDEFDLIIFDRYRLRGILPGVYLESVRAFVERGGAVLVAAGPEFAGVESLARSPLGEILPARPAGPVIEGPVRPEVTEIGLRHPVTQGLRRAANPSGTDAPPWGAWLRHLELDVPKARTNEAQVVMQSPDGDALVVLNRVAEGRVALIATDQIWLWARGYDGGGPQMELLRRLAHWMMGEPELEEEALLAEETPEGDIVVTRRTLAQTPDPLQVSPPDGRPYTVPMQPDGPGRFVARLSEDPSQNDVDALAQGVYRFTQGARSVVAVFGAAAPVEFADPLVRPEPMRTAVSVTGGGVWALEDGMPQLRAVRSGGAAIGRGWVGYTPRDAFVSQDPRVRPLLPPWLWLLIIGTGLGLAWWIEGRRVDGAGSSEVG